VGLNSLKSLNLTNGYPNKNNNKNKNKNKNNKVKSKPLELRSRVKMLISALTCTLECYVFMCLIMTVCVRVKTRSTSDLTSHLVAKPLYNNNNNNNNKCIGEFNPDPYVARAGFAPASEVAGGHTIPFLNWQTMSSFFKW
jgi:hypothetical protein